MVWNFQVLLSMGFGELEKSQLHSRSAMRLFLLSVTFNYSALSFYICLVKSWLQNNTH